jgi:hypothetical protein
MFDRYFPVPPRLLVLAILWALLLPGQATAQVAETRLPVTILVSIDGFRPDYLRRGNSPWLDALAAGGVSAVMRPSFPTKTFPNHWTIVTGDRPDRHGIVANRMEDPARPGEIFTMASRDPFWWNAVPPIWVEAERAQPVDQQADRAINAGDRGGGSRVVRTVMMAGGIDRVEIEGDEMRAPRRGPAQPADHPVHPLRLGDGFAEMPPFPGPRAAGHAR